MSIENFKNILESEKRKLIKTKYKKPSVHNTTIYTANALTKSERRAFNTGHEAATNRLLPLLQKAVEMVEFVDLNTSLCPEHRRNQDIPFCSYNDCDIKIKAREFLADIKKESE